MSVFPLDLTDDSHHWPYRLQEVPIYAINIDESYQREEVGAQIDKIAYAFDYRLYLPLVLSQRKTDYAGVDGQQRLRGLQKGLKLRTILGPGGEHIEITHVPAIVYAGLSRAEEAWLYVKLNRETRHVTSFESFKARLVYKDPNARKIADLVQKHGFVLSLKPGDYHIKAVGALESIYVPRRRAPQVRTGPEALDRALEVIQKSWSLQKNATNGDVIAGLGVFFLRFKDNEINYDVLHETMRQITPSVVVKEAGSRTGGTRGQETRQSSFAVELAVFYNKQARRSKARLLPIAERFPNTNI